jgi:hypothetical protein
VTIKGEKKKNERLLQKMKKMMTAREDIPKRKGTYDSR